MQRFMLKTLASVLAATTSLLGFADETQATCSARTLRGSYGFYRQGAYSGGPLAAVGLVVYDGKGSFTLTQTTIKNGVQVTDMFDPPDTFGYTVNPDCTGTFFDPASGDVFGELVVVQGGNEIDFISLTPTNSVIGVSKRIAAAGD